MRQLVAGIGNVFLGDDGFGVSVAQRLAAGPLPAAVRVADFGIRGLHLAYELLDGGYQRVVLVDAMPRGGEPGTIYVLAPDAAEAGDRRMADAHAMTPDAVLALVRTLGGEPGEVLIVGCEPQSVEEGIGLSPAVERAVEEAVKVVLDLVAPVEPAAVGADAGAGRVDDGAR